MNQFVLNIYKFAQAQAGQVGGGGKGKGKKNEVASYASHTICLLYYVHLNNVCCQQFLDLLIVCRCLNSNSRRQVGLIRRLTLGSLGVGTQLGPQSIVGNRGQYEE